jgi:hypothetical protein
MSQSGAGRRTARPRARKRALYALLLGLSCATHAAAESTTSQATGAPEEFRQLSETAPALSQLAGEVARLRIGEPSFVAVTSLRAADSFATSISPSALEELRTAIRKNVAAAVPLAKIQAEEPLSPLEARSRARRARLPLVLLEPTIKLGSLFLEVTVTKWPQKFWLRSLAPKGVTTETLRLRVGGDALRALIPPAKGPIKRRASFKSPIPAPVALSCGDIDNDGQLDLAFIGRNSIVLGVLSGATFSETARRTWEGLSDVSGTPLRAPLASARMENGLLTVGLSDRAETVHLGSDLKTVGKSPRGYPLPGGDCLSFSQSGGLGPEFSCRVPEETASEPQRTPEVDGASQDAYAFSAFSTPSGVSASLTSTLPKGEAEGRLELSLPSEQLVRLNLPHTGSVLLSGDLDGNGTIEVISSSDSAPGTPDRLRIHTLVGKELRELASFETNSISAVALCPFLGSNPLTLVMVSGGELWLLQ